MQRLVSAVFVLWLGCTAHGYPLDELELPCADEDIAFDFSRSTLMRLGENFVRSPLVTCLKFNNAELGKIESGAFAQLPNLTRLYISDTSLAYTEGHPFSLGEVSALQILILDNAFSSTDYINFAIADTFPELRYLSLRNNNIHTFNEDHSLRQRWSSYNWDYKEPLNTLTKLEYLDLSGNVIASASTVKFPTTLKYLKMSDNSINFFNIPELTNLEVLILDSNSINKISINCGQWDESLCVNGYSKLRHLSVRNNLISYIEPEVFTNLPKLEYLDFSSNKLEDLKLNTFESMKSLKVLKLRCLKSPIILNINTESNIEELDLGAGDLEHLSHGVFENLPRLKKLYLDNNRIETINRSVFLGLSELEILHLEGNRLSYMEEGWSEPLKMMRYLNLNGNLFIALSSLQLTKSAQLVDIYLAKNRLKFLKADSFRNLSQNATVYLIATPEDRQQCTHSPKY